MNRLLPVLATLALSASPLCAATYVWNGAVSDRFSDTANWSGGSPASDPRAELSFPASATRKTVMNDLPGLTVQAIAITGSGYTIGGLPIRLADATVADATTGLTTISCGLELVRDATFVSTSDFFAHPGLTLSGAIGGSGNFIKAGSGRVTLTGSRPNTYAGTTRVTAGELRLAKSDLIAAVPGPLVIEGSLDDSAEVFVPGLEQIADSAPVTVGAHAQLRLPRSEAIGSLTIARGGEISMSADRSGNIHYTGTLVLRGDIAVIASNAGTDARIIGGTALPATRTITVAPGEHGLVITNVTALAPDAALILRRGAGTGPAAVSVGGSYAGPTIVEGADVSLHNLNTRVAVRSGSFRGDVASLTAEGGTVRGGVTNGAVRLGPAVTMALEITDFNLPAAFAHGLTLGGAKLELTFDRYFEHNPGRTYVLVATTDPAPIGGTFAGMPEGTIIGNRFRLSYVGGDGNDVTLTDISRSYSETLLQVHGDRVRGSTLTLEAFVAWDRPGPAAGTVTFRSGDTVIATVPVSDSGVAAATFVPQTHGTYTFTASYQGDATVDPSTASETVIVAPPRPRITSVDPSEVRSGETVLLTVRGTDFYGDELEVLIASDTLEPSFVSPTELRVTWTAPKTATTIELEVLVGTDNGISDSVPIKVLGVPRPPAALTFETQAIRGPVAPGASSAWLRGAVRRVNFTTQFETEYAVVRDADNDGSVTWTLANVVPPNTIAVMVDVSTGTVQAGQPDTSIPDPMPFPATFMRDPSGAYSHIVLEESPHALLWVRPGVGAWRMEITEAAANDVYPAAGLVTSTSFMQPLEGSPRPPAGVERGDVLVGLHDVNAAWFGARVDDHLLTGPGTLSIQSEWGGSEDYGPQRIPVLRTGGSDGVVTVNYTTVDVTAVAGVHYRATAGTLTFGAGEIVKTIEIPLIDDMTFGGSTKFEVRLSEPAGATLGESSVTEVRLHDDDDVPELSIGPDIRVDEGDSGVKQVTITATLSGSTRLPVYAIWRVDDERLGDLRGPLVFAPGETTKTFTANVYGDTLTERDGRIAVSIMDDLDRESAVWIRRYSMNITVVDDDPLPRLLILDGTAKESDGYVRLRLAVVGVSTRPITVTYTLVNGTAVAGSDYVAESRTVDVGTAIDVPLVSDGAPETTEWFTVVLSAAENATLVRGSALAIIEDDDVASQPALSIAGPSVREGDSGTAAAAFVVQLTAPSQSRVTVRWTTEDRTADATDYVPASGEVTFEPGEMVKTIFVNVRGDTATELDETFAVRLSLPAHAAIRNGVAAGTIRNDDAGRVRAVRP